MSDIQAQIDFLNDIKEVTEEFDAAYEVRKEDPERWEAAKAAFQERRTFWRMVNHASDLSEEGAVKVSPVESRTEIKGEELK